MQVNERVYREIFNATSDAIFIQDVQTGAILDVNSAMLEMYGYEYNEALQLSIHDLSLGESPYTRTEAWDLICKALEQGPQTFEWLARKKNGESFWVEVVLRRMEIAGEAQILAVVRDITERHAPRKCSRKRRKIPADHHDHVRLYFLYQPDRSRSFLF